MDSNKIPSQLYHTLNTGAFTYCMICMETICNKSDNQVEESRVKAHLNGLNHQENVKFLFKLCIPDLFQNEPNFDNYSGNCLDIVKKSVFDISYLLGGQTSYICYRNENYLVCLLCRQEVAEIQFTNKKMMKRIVCHLQSDRHFKSVKDTNWIYHFNCHKSFFRFNRTQLYCSICKDSFKFQEYNMLQFADFHLKNFHQISLEEKDNGMNLQDLSQANTPSVVAEALPLGNSCANNSVSDNSDSVSSEKNVPVKDPKANSYICHLCLRDIDIIDCRIRHSIDNHCVKHHEEQCLQSQGPTLFRDIVCFNQRFVSHKLVVRKYPGIKLLSKCVPVFANNCTYIQIFGNICFCSLCSAMVAYHSDLNDLLKNFTVHFQSDEHNKVLKKKGNSGCDKFLKKKLKDLKRLKKPLKTKKVAKKNQSV